MLIQQTATGSLDYEPCHYGTSKIPFRGPKRGLVQPFIACVGGSETYGRYVPDPFPALLEARLGLPVVNLGWMNAGIDVFMHDPAVVEICRKAELCVVQVTGAQNISNRLYSVHPRRNDRFVKPSPLLSAIYGEVDFSDIHFTRHLLTTLYATSAQRFSIVESELATAWLARMKLFLDRLGANTMLLWLSRIAPPDEAHFRDDAPDPLFVDCAMLDLLSAYVRDTVIAPLSAQARESGTNGMVFAPLEEPAARQLPSVLAHGEVAEALAGPVSTFLQKKRPTTGAGPSGKTL